MTDNQPELLPSQTKPSSPAEQAKRDAYRQRLAEYLKDSQFRAIEGFPIGTDEDILALSDPPYYTACPNPFLPEIIAEWQAEREELRKNLELTEEGYQREPFATDVSEGKNHPIYNAHSYHTKVPHKAIMRYILHYTDPGDIVFDGFCGTGMTGVAAQLCGDKKAVEELGYRVDDKGFVWEKLPSPGSGRGNEGEGKPFSRLGARKAVLNDLSPAATFIAYNYVVPGNPESFESSATRTLKEVEGECGWMYETWHPNCDAINRIKGKINYTVWSDVFICPQCGIEMLFWDVAVNFVTWEVKDFWNCPQCKALLSKSPSAKSNALRAERSKFLVFDKKLNRIIQLSKQEPAMISYVVGKKRLIKRPDVEDINLLHRIEDMEIPYPIPIRELPIGYNTQQPIESHGITHVYLFYTHRNLWALSSFIDKLNDRKRIIDAISTSTIISKMYRFRSQNGSLGAGGGPLAGTLYIPSLSKEIPILKALKEHIAKTYKKYKFLPGSNTNIVSTASHTEVRKIPSESINYIFTDPPFGGNIMYSELNFIWESWLRVFTNNKPEAIVNKVQGKNVGFYQQLMVMSFQEAFRILKSGSWLTVEFHNSQNSVWNAIQESLQHAGFVIADVRVLDKQQTTFKQATTTAAVKKDLIISAYKPNGNLEERFKLKAGSEDGAWEFVRYHLGKLPVVNQTKGSAVVNAERQAYLLFDRMVAFHIQRGVMVPISSPGFYAGLEQRFIRRDGMYFLPDQVGEYDRALLDSGKPIQMPLFVTDEKTAITWLRQQLDPTSGGEPQTRGDLTNLFNQTMHRAKHEVALELIEILEQNFLQDEVGKWYVPDHNKASDLDKVRGRSLLKEFNEYANTTGRLKQFRTEAVRAGFADCFKRQEYDAIVKLAERLPEDVLREDPDLLMYYDSALLRKK